MNLIVCKCILLVIKLISICSLTLSYSLDRLPIIKTMLIKEKQCFFGRYGDDRYTEKGSKILRCYRRDFNEGEERVLECVGGYGDILV